MTMRRRSGTLEISFSSGGRPEDYEGEYQCFASNLQGMALSNKIRLQVSSEDRPRRLVPPPLPSLTLCVPPRPLRGSSLA